MADNANVPNSRATKAELADANQTLVEQLQAKSAQVSELLGQLHSLQAQYTELTKTYNDVKKDWENTAVPSRNVFVGVGFVVGIIVGLVVRSFW